MKKVVVVLVVLVVLAAIVGGLAYADLRIRGLAEEHAEQQLAQALPQVRGVEVVLDGFPFTLGVLVSGKVDGLHVRLVEVSEAGLTAQDLSLDVEEITLDKDALIDEQRLVVTDIGRATAQGFVGDGAVSKVVGQKITFTPGKAHATVQGRELEVKASVKGRVVQLSSSIPGVPPVVFPLPPGDVLPCSPELELLEGKIRLSCSIDELPAKLKEAMAKG
jgi:LmeA-like phospholipid-binding